MVTYDEFVYYKMHAIHIFDYCKGKILRYITDPIREVDYMDTVNYTYANIRRPNMVFLHIGNICAEYPWRSFNDTLKRISLIFTAIVHELYHLEQPMSQELYRTDQVYKITVEKSVEEMTYKFLLENKAEIDDIFDINLDLSYSKDLIIKNQHKNWSMYYKQASVEDMYKNTIMNVIFRKDISFNRFCEEILDRYDNISIGFENGLNFLIKNNGEFCEQSLNGFISAVGAVAGIYDRYTVDVNVVELPYRDKEYIANVMFTLSNRSIYPMMFKKPE